MGNFLSFWTAAAKQQSISEDTLQSFAATLRKDIIGQTFAIEQIKIILSDNVHSNPSNSFGPRCTLLFSGPHGMGKTPMAKAIAAKLYGQPISRIDMKDYISWYQVEQLQETFKKISKLTGRVIVLYDLDEAHPDAIAVLESVLLGQAQDFHAFIFIITVTTSDDRATEIPRAVAEKLSPETVAILQKGMVSFQTLHPNHLQEIVRTQWERIAGEFGKTGPRLALLDEDVAELLRDLFDPVSGWTDVPHLERYLLNLYWAKTSPTGNSKFHPRRLVRDVPSSASSSAPAASSSAPASSSSNTQAIDEQGQPSRKRWNSTDGGGRNKKKKTTFAGSSSNVAESSAVTNSTTTTTTSESHNPTTESHNSTTSTNNESLNKGNHRSTIESHNNTTLNERAVSVNESTTANPRPIPTADQDGL